MSVPVWVARRSTAAVAPSDPTSVANLYIWLDASDLSTVSTSSSVFDAPTATGQTVRQWKSKVGTALFTIRSGTPLAQISPIGRHSIQLWNRFLNNADQLSSTNQTGHPPSVANLPAGTAQGFTVIHLLQRTQVVSQGYGLTQPAGTPTRFPCFLLNNNSGWSVIVATGTAAATTASTFNQTTNPNSQRAISNSVLDYVETTLNYSTNQLITSIGITNTVKKTTAVTPHVWVTNNRWTIGGQYNATGCDIAELLVYNRTLTAAELSTVKAYLTAKWGL